jgi:uncharacterized protein YjbI with pentapeptide repeats
MTKASQPSHQDTSKVHSGWLALLALAAFLVPGVAVAEETFNPEDIARLESSANCPRCRLAGADLKGIDLNGARLSYAVLSGAILDHALLGDADLRFAQLEGTSLQHATLTSSDMRGANLRGANLGFANLVHSDLRNADLRNAILTKANLKATDLHGARLEGANLMGAKGLTLVRLAGACGDETTKLPARVKIEKCASEPEADGVEPGDGEAAGSDVE